MASHFYIWNCCYPGQRLDPAFHFYPSLSVYPQLAADCSVVLHWPIWFAALSLFPYRLLGLGGLYLIPLLAGLGTAILSGMLTWRFRPSLAPLTILLVGLGTPLLFYSVLFWEHTLVVFLGLVALWHLLQLPARERPWREVLIAGVCLLIATALKTEMIVFALCLAVSTMVALTVYHRTQLRRWLNRGLRQDLWRVAVVGVFLAALTWLLFVARLPQAGEGAAACAAVDGPTGQRGLTALQRAPSTTMLQLRYGLGDPAEHSLGDALGRTWFYGFDSLAGGLTGQLGFVGVALCLIAGVILAVRTVRNPRPGPDPEHWLLLGGIVLVLAGALQVLLFPERFRFIHAVFLSAPFMVLAVLFVPAAFRTWRYRGGLMVLLAGIYLVMGTIMLLMREAYRPFSHPEWGARYLLPLYPLLTVCALVGLAETLERLRAVPDPMARLYRKVLTVLALALALVGVSFTVLGIRELRWSKQDISAYQAAATATNQPMVTDLPWLPSALAPYYASHEIYVVDDQHDLGQWLEEVGGEVEQFVYVGSSNLDFGALNRNPGARHELWIQDQAFVRGVLFTEIRIGR